MLFEKIHLEENELILKVVRKHWFIIFSELFFILLMSLLPLVVFVAVGNFTMISGLLTLDSLPVVPLVIFLVSGWLVICLIAAYVIWTNYYLDLWIITDRRIVVVEQLSFFNRNISMFRIERLQDIEVRTVGLLQTFLNYGTLAAQTAGHFESNFNSSGLPDPRGLQAIIQKAMDERLQKLHTTDPLTMH
jgi:uncharacterized membrane protein YdbT with pleckstrin-like domain